MKFTKTIVVPWCFLRYHLILAVPWYNVMKGSLTTVLPTRIQCFSKSASSFVVACQHSLEPPPMKLEQTAAVLSSGLREVTLLSMWMNRVYIYTCCWRHLQTLTFTVLHDLQFHLTSQIYYLMFCVPEIVFGEIKTHFPQLLCS